MAEEPNASVDLLIEAALREDVGPGDWTTLWTVDPDAHGFAQVVAKEDLVVAGTRVSSRVFRQVESRLRVRIAVPDGERAERGSVVMEVEGPLRGILTGERTSLNFLGRLSGIATLTRRYVEAVEGTGAVILDTRKTTPGWRSLEKEAVRAGGGENHRCGLFDMILIKDNHLAAAGGVREAVSRVRGKAGREMLVELEVSTLEELEEALTLDVDRILLDNMSVETVTRAVQRTQRLGKDRPRLEASGNVSLATVRSMAETGVDFISVGALTHSAPSADLSLRILTKS